MVKFRANTTILINYSIHWHIYLSLVYIIVEVKIKVVHTSTEYVVWMATENVTIAIEFVLLYILSIGFSKFHLGMF